MQWIELSGGWNRPIRTHLTQLRISDEVELIASDRAGGNSLKQRVVRLKHTSRHDRVLFSIQAKTQNAATIVYTVLDTHQVALILVEPVDAAGRDRRSAL